MTRILTVDDSSVVRMLVKRALTDMDVEIDEADDGETGLLAVEKSPPDLILLDVTMPGLDGPGMLKRLRSRGIATPVVLLTAESGTSLIGSMMKQGGICEYIAKPFKPEQLRAKVVEALQRQGTVVGESGSSEAGTSSGRPGKTAFDVLVVDDMENVAKRLRALLPERLTFDGCLDRATALTLCRDKTYRAVILDTDIPGVDTTELVRDLRILQPTATFVALLMRAAKNPHELATAAGFGAFLSKPFDPRQVEEFVGTYFETQDALVVDGNVLTPATYQGPESGQDNFHRKLLQMILDASQVAAAACYENLILDLSAMPASSRAQKLLLRVANHCKEIGLPLRVVAGPDLAKLLKQLIETATIPVVDSVDAAKAA